jgi:hypothetical protein
VGELSVDERLRDDADHLAARGERPVGDGTHQADAASTVDHAQAACGGGRSERSGRADVCGRTTTRRTAEDADPAHDASVPAPSTVPGT